ncbi:membrane protein [Friedmanniella luteola]|uniref:Membrane protein n=1 Tax=Friedmanniella luteola TaxID=546871 RepID=A0A1H1TU95_9ACTN|nr:YhjD/YihY/BrkB family envelope integrity protein [Friedmanniella luteola]SDS63189.1 membrane protein [Friedmanniella luteola]
MPALTEPTSPSTAGTPALPSGVPHLLRAVERYISRLGAQFAGAITYFSVLAVIPILMFAFSAAGLVLTVTRPELLLPLADAIADTLGTADPATRQQILDLVRSALSNWRSIGILGLVSAVYSGAGWMGNLKNAVRAQWRPEFDVQAEGGNVLLLTLKIYVVNLLQLLALLLAMAITFGLAALSTTFAGTLLSSLGLAEIGWLNPLLRLVPVVFSIAAGSVLFLFLYTVLPETRAPRRTVRRAALIGSVGLAVLQYLSTFLVSLFSGNRAFAVFGSVIALMLFLNLFAQLILFMAAWIATADHPAAPPARVEAEVVRFPLVAPEPAEPAEVLAGRRTGWLLGAAAGAGLGAAVTWWLARRR